MCFFSVLICSPHYCLAMQESACIIESGLAFFKEEKTLVRPQACGQSKESVAAVLPRLSRRRKEHSGKFGQACTSCACFRSFTKRSNLRRCTTRPLAIYSTFVKRYGDECVSRASSSSNSSVEVNLLLANKKSIGFGEILQTSGPVVGR